MTTLDDHTPVTAEADDSSPTGVQRRSFLGYVIGGATLTVAADLALAETATASPGTPAMAAPGKPIPSAPGPAELYDLSDFLTESNYPTQQLIAIRINKDGTASFALPRAEVGQGILTSTAMIIAEELELPVKKVRVSLAKARPELVFNQLTGGSNSTVSTYTPIRVAAAIAKNELLRAASILLGDNVDYLQARNGVVYGTDGASVTYGDLAERASSLTTRAVDVVLKQTKDFRVIGVGHNRLDAHDAVTGKKKYATDLQVKDALPTMVCRAPTLNGRPIRIHNRKTVQRMPGVRNIALMEFGIAVRAETFGQCIDAVRALRADWEDGPVAGMSDIDVVKELKAAQLPIPQLPTTPLSTTIGGDFLFYFRSNSAMDTNSAVADVRKDKATIWAGMKSPITAQQRIAEALGMRQDQVTCNVVTAGGSFGRRLFFDGPMEAALISQKMGKPVKLMWHRCDDARAGRTHPMTISRVRAVVAEGAVVAFQQDHTSVETDFSHGLGEVLSATLSDIPEGNKLAYSESIFELTQEVPYNFGAVAQSLVETEGRFNTGSMRNIYSPDVRAASELIVDQIAKKLGKDPFEFRKEFIKNQRTKDVLVAAARRADWGKKMPKGTAQGIAIHKEYKGVTACVVEIDCRPATVNRPIKDGVTGPRVTKVTFVVDAGLVINPRGLQAQMQGGINDGIALALTSSMHLRDGHFLEGSWDNYFYTRQWNTPPEVDVHIMASESDQPGGAGEAGVASTFAAVACAYARAVGKMPTYFPINHRDPLAFKPKPFVPPIPQSPTNGLKLTY